MAESILQKGGGSALSDECTALRAHVLAPYTAMTSDSNDEVAAGTMQSMGAQTVTPALSAQTVGTSGKYMTGNVIVNPIPNQQGCGKAAVSCGVNPEGLYYYIKPGFYTGDQSGNSWVYMPVANAANAIGIQSVVSFNVAPYSVSQVLVTWKNPSKGPYGGVIICAKTGSYPTSISEGRIYTGTGNNAVINGMSSVILGGLAAGATYYFRIWMYCTYTGGTLYSGYLQATCTTTAHGRVVISTSQMWTVPANIRTLNVHAVGGGGGGAWGSSSGSGCSGGGGGGGYTAYRNGISVTSGQSEPVTVGLGGGSWEAGGVSSAFGVVANGGEGGRNINGNAAGGSGSGSPSYNARVDTGGNGGTDGSDGEGKRRPNNQGWGNPGWTNGGKGQGTTTREFGNGSLTLYSGGGAGAGGADTSDSTVPYGGAGGAGGGGNGSAGKYTRIEATSGIDGTGGGGGGCHYNRNGPGKGGNGIVIITW